MGLVESGRPVVLIVEDEFLVRIDAADMVRAGGFEVVEAADADEAIEILETRSDIAVVFTDIQMPGSMDGLKLARRRPGPLASDQDYRNLRPPPYLGNRTAGGRPVLIKTL
jgi:CheY-like chemotaxis protein